MRFLFNCFFFRSRLVVLISNTADLVIDYQLADHECKELRRELEIAQTKFSTYSTIINQQTKTTSSSSNKVSDETAASEAAERAAEKLADEKMRSRSRGRKEQ